jgi:hypothetical protein
MENEKYWRNSRGKRIYDIWPECKSEKDFPTFLPIEFGQFCQNELSWDNERIWYEAERFWEYWISDDANKPAKKNWLQVWQRWCRTSNGRPYRGPPGS